MPARGPEIDNEVVLLKAAEISSRVVDLHEAVAVVELAGRCGFFSWTKLEGFSAGCSATGVSLDANQIAPPGRLTKNQAEPEADREREALVRRHAHDRKRRHHRAFPHALARDGYRQHRQEQYGRHEQEAQPDADVDGQALREDVQDEDVRHLDEHRQAEHKDHAAARCARSRGRAWRTARASRPDAIA